MVARGAAVGRCGAAVAAVVISLAAAPTLAAPAQEAQAPDWAFGDPVGEGVLAAASALSLFAYALPQAIHDWRPSSDGPRDDGYGMASDFTGAFVGTSWQLVGSWALEVDYFQERGIGAPFSRALRTSLMDAEAVLLTVGITTTVKRLSGRCRPRAWRDDHCAGGEHDAFPSGHVSPVAALAGSRFLMAARSESGAVQRQIAYGFAEGASVTTAVLRVLAGAHSWEDVVAGWAIGHLVGILVGGAHPVEPIAPESTGAATAASLGRSSGDLAIRWSGAF